MAKTPKRKSKSKGGRKSAKREPASQHAGVAKPARAEPEPRQGWSNAELAFGVGLLIAFVWSYLPVLTDLVNQWIRVPDYSHGFLVAPVAIYFLYAAKHRFPVVASGISWWGFSLVLVAAILRTLGAIYYLEALQGISIPIWIGGVVWMFFGWRVFKWSLPAVVFLVFMVPIPYSLETMLSQPLQKTSTTISLFILQFFQQPALSEGTTIVLGEHTLEIERACSGLRIFFGIAAMAYAFILIYRCPKWSIVGLIAAILPIALLSNSFRIVLTGLLFQLGLGDVANHVSHDFAGIVMVFVAAVLFWLTLQYLDRLFPTVSTVDLGSLARSSRNSA